MLAFCSLSVTVYSKVKETQLKPSHMPQIQMHHGRCQLQPEWHTEAILSDAPPDWNQEITTLTLSLQEYKRKMCNFKTVCVCLRPFVTFFIQNIIYWKRRADSGKRTKKSATHSWVYLVLLSFCHPFSYISSSFLLMLFSSLGKKR